MHSMVLLDTQFLSKKSVEKLEKITEPFGQLTHYHTTNEDEVLERCGNCDIIITNKAKLTAEHLSNLPNVKYILEVATGYDNVDIVAARKNGIFVSNIPTYSTASVAQHTIALMLEMFNNVSRWNIKSHHSEWNHKKGITNVELKGLTFGCIGYGNIAKVVIPVVQSLGMKVIVTSKTKRHDTDSIRFVDKQTLFAESDVISLHCPVTHETRHIINADSLQLMKKSTCIVNTGRGLLIDEDALYEALSSKQIAGAALDVLSVEPAQPECKLLQLDNCIITPHVAFLTKAAMDKWFDTIVHCLEGFSRSAPINVVN